MIKQHTLILGLNDKVTKQQEISTLNAYKLCMNTILNNKFSGATITETQGFYTHDNGDVVFETSLKIDLLFAQDEQVYNLITILKQTFNQETIALIISDINSQLV